jgi:hypothetical protein
VKAITQLPSSPEGIPFAQQGESTLEDVARATPCLELAGEVIRDIDVPAAGRRTTAAGMRLPRWYR